LIWFVTRLRSRLVWWWTENRELVGDSQRAVAEVEEGSGSSAFPARVAVIAGWFE
jgi:hypothetical protein